MYENFQLQTNELTNKQVNLCKKFWVLSIQTYSRLHLTSNRHFEISMCCRNNWNLIRIAFWILSESSESSEFYRNLRNLIGIFGFLSESSESHRNLRNLIGISGISSESLESLESLRNLRNPIRISGIFGIFPESLQDSESLESRVKKNQLIYPSLHLSAHLSTDKLKKTYRSHLQQN